MSLNVLSASRAPTLLEVLKESKGLGSSRMTCYSQIDSVMTFGYSQVGSVVTFVINQSELPFENLHEPQSFSVVLLISGKTRLV